MIEFCTTHDIGWYYHERDDTCKRTEKQTFAIMLNETEKLMVINALQLYLEENRIWPTLAFDIEHLQRRFEEKEW